MHYYFEITYEAEANETEAIRIWATDVAQAVKRFEKTNKVSSVTKINRIEPTIEYITKPYLSDTAREVLTALQSAKGCENSDVYINDDGIYVFDFYSRGKIVDKSVFRTVEKLNHYFEVKKGSPK